MHVLPQEIEVWYIIPAIRKAMANCLINDFKYSYDRVGKTLGISKAAVSQYAKNKRASKIKLHKSLNEEILKSCKKIDSGKSTTVKEMMRLLDLVAKKNLPCEVCQETRDGILKDCKEIRVGDYG